ncbi:MAG: hypothetical protein KDB53_09485, partial [Planctomycetes bacterium]|nr:hypothetical protein [Planctomycetota bacterium]
RQSSPVVLVAIGVGLTLVAATLDGGFAPRGLGPAFLDLLVPLPRSLPLDAGRGLALAASFLTAIGGLVVGGLIVGSAAQRTRIVSLALAALALSMAFPQAYALSAAWLALTLAASAMALRHPGPREVMTGALLVFLAYTSVNAARERLHALKSHEHELGVIQAQLDNLPDDLDDLLLLGVPDHHGYRAALIADTSHPFSATPRRLRVAHEGHWERLGDDLLDGGDRRLILEWGPINLLTAGQRPEGWRLVPRLRGSNSVGDDSGIRLLEPTNGIRIPVAAPRRLDEDLAFVFEIAAPPAPATLPALVFYGFHEVAFGPKSREFGVRRLEPAVLEELEGSPGWRRLRWRTSVRPGPGEDGLAFDDPDRGLAGHSFWWTVGRIDQATIPDEAVTPFPESVAPTQRIWFSPTKDR